MSASAAADGGRVPDVSILIVAYGSRACLPRLFDALDAQSFRDFETILIDNASPPQTRPDPASAARAGMFVQNLENTGFAAANNQAAGLARGRWLALLNPDAFPEPDWLAALAAARARHPDCDQFGSTQILDGDPARLDGAGDMLHAAGIMWRGGHRHRRPERMTDGEPFSACAAASLWRAERFSALGGFETAFFCYCEDVELGFRHRLAGGRCVQVADARVRHIGSASSGRASDFAVFHGTRNRMWTHVRCMPGALFWPLLPLHAALALLFWLQAARRGAGRAYGRGLWAGLAGLTAQWRTRKAIQAGRKAPAAGIARHLVWSPVAMLRRAVKLGPV